MGRRRAQSEPQHSLRIGDREIVPGSRLTIELPVPQLYTQSPMTMPVHVCRGKREGPRLFVCAAIHGDEINGIEIIRRLLIQPGIKRLRGTLIALPMVNVYGVVHHSRYFPDRRDLNRSFPGSERGSLAGRVANRFMSEIVAKCTHGIDLHTGANHRSNLPQIRADMGDEETARLAHSFGVPVILDSNVRDGSLRAAAGERGVSMLLYEAGEALRFDELAIRVGLEGIKHVMRALGMLPRAAREARHETTFVAHSSRWERAPQSGVLGSRAGLGKRVYTGELLAKIHDPLNAEHVELRASCDGVVIGRTNLPLVHEGDALFHIARFGNIDKVEEGVEAFQQLQATDYAEDPAEPGS